MQIQHSLDAPAVRARWLARNSWIIAMGFPSRELHFPCVMVPCEAFRHDQGQIGPLEEIRSSSRPSLQLSSSAPLRESSFQGTFILCTCPTRSWDVVLECGSCPSALSNEGALIGRTAWLHYCFPAAPLVSGERISQGSGEAEPESGCSASGLVYSGGAKEIGP